MNCYECGKKIAPGLQVESDDESSPFAEDSQVWCSRRCLKASEDREANPPVDPLPSLQDGTYFCSYCGGDDHPVSECWRK